MHLCHRVLHNNWLTFPHACTWPQIVYGTSSAALLAQMCNLIAMRANAVVLRGTGS